MNLIKGQNYNFGHIFSIEYMYIIEHGKDVYSKIFWS